MTTRQQVPTRPLTDQQRHRCWSLASRLAPLDEAAGAFVDALVRCRDGEADEAFAGGAVAVTGRDDDADVLDQARGVLGGGLALRDAGPDVEAGLGRLHAQAAGPQRL